MVHSPPAHHNYRHNLEILKGGGAKLVRKIEIGHSGRDQQVCWPKMTITSSRFGRMGRRTLTPCLFNLRLSRPVQR